MTYVYLGLGGNVGQPRDTLRRALREIEKLGGIVAVSSLYETAPVGFLDQPPFLNAVVVLDTEIKPLELLAGLLEIERRLGRVRSVPNAPRTVDLDILLYGDLVLDEPPLTVPHPRLHERAFVLVPLAEVAPYIDHPVLGRTISDLLTELGPIDALVQKREDPEWAFKEDGRSGGEKADAPDRE